VGYRLKSDGTVIDVGNVTEYEITVPTDGTYAWTVAAYDAAHGVSPYADPWSFAVDTRSPRIDAVSPLDGAGDVAIREAMTIAFDEPIEEASFAYTVEPDPGGWMASWKHHGTEVTLTHDPFDYDTEYTVTITGAEDEAGNPLVGLPYDWRFSTESPPVTPVLLSPEDGAVLCDALVTLRWGIGANAVGYLLDWDGDIIDVGDVTEYEVTVPADGTYTWTVAAYDAASDVSPYADPWSFSVDTRAPRIVATSPSNDAEHVAVTEALSITFSKPVDADTFAYAVAPEADGWSASWNNEGTVVTLAHAPLASDCTYTATVASAEDQAGNPLLDGIYAWSFTTAVEGGDTYNVYLPFLLK
jgi:hypothetical protein